MIASIVAFSVKNKLIIVFLVFGLMLTGLNAIRSLPIDAVPDITNNQVQVVTTSPSLVAQEVEQLITYPVEVAMANIPNLVEVRSISRFGLSVVTVVFEDHIPVLEARQFVREQIDQAVENIPQGLGLPTLMPITTGLGEIYQYVLQVQPGYEDQYDPMRLRTIQDWIVKRQLAGVKGIIETSSFGGFLKQYEVALKPDLMQSLDITIPEVLEAIAANNENSGGSYIEQSTNAYYIRTEGTVKSQADIAAIVVAIRNNLPVLVGDIAAVRLGYPQRYGAMTMNGQGEAVGGITLMLKGANTSEALANVQERMAAIQETLPEGINIVPYLDRADLVGSTIRTVRNNLLEGGIIVILVLVLLIGDFRAGLIVASVVPLSMLFALALMQYFGVSANLMSLGAIDFGIVVDGPIIIIEGIMASLMAGYAGKKLLADQFDAEVIQSTTTIYRAAVFGVLITLVVFIPIMTLTGVEGKMFKPMAYTFSFAVLGALLLSVTYVPMMASWFLKKKIRSTPSYAERLINGIWIVFSPMLRLGLTRPILVVGVAILVFMGILALFQRMGAEFMPTLEEGDIAMQMTIPPGSSLSESISSTTKAERIILAHFPEVKGVVSKIGTAEVPTDPMAIEDADIMILLKEKSAWTTAKDREGLVAAMKEKLEVMIGASFEFTQPIQLRFNELMTGAKTDIAVKIFGENTAELARLGQAAEAIISKIPGAADVRVDQTEGMPQWQIQYDREKLAIYGLNVSELNTIIRAAYAGEKVGVVFENERTFDLVIRLNEAFRQNLDLNQLWIRTPNGTAIPVSTVADIQFKSGPMQISRESARRRITIGVNIRDRDVSSLVSAIRNALHDQLDIPPGYMITYGGQFENLEKAQQRLLVAVPIALALILLFLYLAFGTFKYALIIFLTVPFAAIGGILALWLRGMPFSISAGVGFIALFGVSVLDGIVLISRFNQIGGNTPEVGLFDRILEGVQSRLRPVLMTTITTALGFLPMALSMTNGAEVQRPLATVVIGGCLSATLLTLFVLPVVYAWVERYHGRNPKSYLFTVMILFCTLPALSGQEMTKAAVLNHATQNFPNVVQAHLRLEQAKLENDKVKQLEPTQFNLQFGQINGRPTDYMFSVLQPLDIQKRRQARQTIADATVGVAQAELALTRRQLIYQVELAWLEWIYWNDQIGLSNRQLTLLNAMEDKVKERIDSGRSPSV